jgi:hypothetical protein
MLAPPKIYLWCFSRDMHDEVHCILQLIMQWVWSCTFCTPFKEAVSLQHIEHSSKHAAFFSEEVQFPFRKLFNYSAFVQSYSISFKTPDSYSRCSMWLTLSIAVKMCNGWRSLQHSLKRKIVVKGKCCLQVALCLEDKIVPWTRRTILATKYICGKMKYILLWSSAFLSFSFYDHFLMKDLYTVMSSKWLPWRQCCSSNIKQYSCRKKYNMWKDAIHPFWSSAWLWMTVVFKGKT